MSTSLIKELDSKWFSSSESELILQHKAVHKAYLADAISIGILGNNSDLLIREYYQNFAQEEPLSLESFEGAVNHLVSTTSPHQVLDAYDGDVCWAYLLPDLWELAAKVIEVNTREYDDLIERTAKHLYSKTAQEMTADLADPSEDAEYDQYALPIEDALKKLSRSTNV